MSLLSRIRSMVLFRKLSAAQKMARGWERESNRLLESLEKKEKQIEKIVSKFDRQASTVRSEIDHIKGQVAKHEKTLNALRDENEVLTEITVPMLTANCKMAVERWEAETAIQVGRKALALPQLQSKEI